MKFGYTIVYVKDVAKSLSFYEVAFGFKTKFLHESNDYGELETGETTLAFASYELGDSNFNGQYIKGCIDNKPFGLELAFVSKNVRAAYNKALAAGAISIKEPEQKPWGQIIAYVRTMDGELIELCSPIEG
ncbi:MAG: lactoylglutathione lyase [Alteromonadaceae bacterium]|jgi:lactoylglutathione lyase